ncbi:AraC family transcriptional regulator [Kribbella deserti]|uniref:AraC family transcriptional regulator n=1 Tax=Kribbella deserti TaxID=1926257 RepID=A0ABV6QJS7_9ACTN
MDVLDDLLAGTRARGGVFNQTVLDPPWSLLIADEATLALATMIRGDAWLLFEGAEPIRLRERDIAVIRGPVRYVVADDPGTAPRLLIKPNGVCEPLPGATEHDGPSLGPRTHGRRPDGQDLLVSGVYQMKSDVSRRLLAALPPVLVVPADQVAGPVMDLLTAEISRDDPGQQVVLDRWLDLALIITLRAWFARPESKAPGWYQAQGDPVVGQALRLIHEDPARGWTVAELADRCGASRANLARRFSALVGAAPMAYLTGWRITLAADLLRDTDDTVESIARKVGYANAFALSVAFKRIRGISPSAHRKGEALASSA